MSRIPRRPSAKEPTRSLKKFGGFDWRAGSPADLVGKTIIAERPANPDFVLIMDELIRVYGLPRDEIRIVSTANTSEAMRALRVGSVDGALLPFSAGSALVQQALNDDLLEFLIFPLDERDEILRNLPAAIQGNDDQGRHLYQPGARCPDVLAGYPAGRKTGRSGGDRLQSLDRAGGTPR